MPPALGGLRLEYKTSMVIKGILTSFIMFLAMSFCSGWFCKASARVNVAKTKKLELPAKTGDDTMADLLSVEILPDKIADGETTNSFLTKMADNSLSLAWKNSPLRYSAAGKAVETAEKKLNVEAVYQDAHQVSHKFNFKVLAIQALAKIQYTGWVNAALNYDLKAARAAAEVSEALSERNDLVLRHEVSNTEQTSAVSLQWKW